MDQQTSTEKAWPKSNSKRNCASEPVAREDNESPGSDLDDTNGTMGSDNVFSPGAPINKFLFHTGMNSTATNASFAFPSGSSGLMSCDLSFVNSSRNSSMVEDIGRGENVTSNENRDPIEIPDLKIDLNSDVNGIMSPKVDTENDAPKTSKSRKQRSEEVEAFEDTEVIFHLKKWNHVSLWKWDVDCDICAICRVVICDPCLTVSFFNLKST